MALADVQDKVAQELLALRRVRDLWVELEAVDVAVRVGDGRERGRARVRDGGEARWQLGELVAVAHPHLHLGPEAVKEGVAAMRARVDRDRRVPVLAVVAREHLAAQHPCELLQPVADAEDGNPGLEQAGLRMRCALLVHRRRPARQNDP